jgi:amidase
MTFCKRLAYGATVLAICIAALSAPASADERFEITETTIAETQQAIREHRVSCHQIVDGYLGRIRAYDQSTHLNSLVVLNPNALAEADKFDAEFKLSRTIRGLQCIAVIVKDNSTRRICRPPAVRWR